MNELIFLLALQSGSQCKSDQANPLLNYLLISQLAKGSAAGAARAKPLMYLALSQSIGLSPAAAYLLLNRENRKAPAPSPDADTPTESPAEDSHVKAAKKKKAPAEPS